MNYELNTFSHSTIFLKNPLAEEVFFAMFFINICIFKDKLEMKVNL